MLLSNELAGDAIALVEKTTGNSNRNSSAAAREIWRSYARFCDLLTLAEEKFAVGELPAATALCHIAARCAYPANVGLFASHRLEKLLLAIGRRLPTVSHRGTGCPTRVELNILHVLSYGRPIGGDSRFVWRWIQADKTNRHNVVITTQADISKMYDVPEVLRKAAGESGGFLTALSAPTSRPLDQAYELRTLCQTMDFVILHLFPYDIVPSLALAASCESVRTLFVNHSDHTFWIGARVADSVVHLRQQSREFLTQRRGLDPDRCSILPIPVPQYCSGVSTPRVKEFLGLKSDEVILLTIASPFKYNSPGQPSFLELVAPVIANHPSAHLIAVGPDPEDPAWRSARERTGGRIIARGTHWDNNNLYAAADIYLDSIPFSSITSLLEAGSRGIPLLGYRSNDPELDLMGPGAPGLDESMLIANSAESYQLILGNLIAREETRHRTGAIAKEQILKHHDGDNWQRQIHRLYHSDIGQSRGCLVETEDSFEVGALNLALVQLYPKINTRQLIAKYVGPLSYSDRISLSWRLFASGFGLCFLNFLPRSVDVAVRTVGRGVKGTLAMMFRHRK